MRQEGARSFRLDDVALDYGAGLVLDGVSFDVEAGKTSLLLGPSGSGKSSCMRLMLGLAMPNKGRVSFEGRVIDKKSARLLRLKFGYVPQSGGLFPHLDALGNMSLMARYLGWTTQDIQARLDILLPLLSFDKLLLNNFPQDLSGGQRQRLSLIRALMLDPDVLFLDEPFGALDSLVRHDLQDELNALFKKLGKTVVMITHDMAEAALFADHVILLHEGRVIQKGAMRDLVKAPATDFVHRFLTARRDLTTCLEERG